MVQAGSKAFYSTWDKLDTYNKFVLDDLVSHNLFLGLYHIARRDCLNTRFASQVLPDEHDLINAALYTALAIPSGVCRYRNLRPPLVRHLGHRTQRIQLLEAVTNNGSSYLPPKYRLERPQSVLCVLFRPRVHSSSD